MNQLARAWILFPLTLWAAELWETKPFQDWSDKDLQRVISRSPWARQTRAAVAGGSAAAPANATPPIGEPSAVDPGNPRSPALGGGGLAGGADRLGAGQAELGQNAPPVAQQNSWPIVLRWQTALPLRQAQMRGKYGREASASPEALKFLAQEPGLYLIAITGLPGPVVSAGAGDQAKERVLRGTTLVPKGKAPIRPIGVELIPSGGGVDVLVGFPRTAPIALEDQEVDFTSQIGTATVKYKFRLKEMVFKGKLEL